MTDPAADDTREAPAEPAPHPDDSRKPDSPSKLRGRSWRYGLKRAVGEFSKDHCTDLAAALTYYAVLSLFPALIAVVSLLGVFGQGPQTIDALLQMVREVGSASVADSVREPLTQLSAAPAAGLGLIIGLAGALWSASGYVGAFARAMNRIYDVDEGRPFWKLRPSMLLLTALLVVLVAVALVALAVSGPVAESLGSQLGLGSAAVLAWRIAKWPLALLVVVVIVALLYYATPNVRQPRFRWTSVGALLAILTWLVASVAFGFYVANFGSYNATYGALAGVIVFLLWLWITNLALLLGAEVDAEIERSRQLQAGIVAEESIQLPPRDTKASEKAAKKAAKQRAKGRDIRTNR